MHTVEQLMIAGANRLELWMRGAVCDTFRLDYLAELVAELRDHAVR